MGGQLRSPVTIPSLESGDLVAGADTRLGVDDAEHESLYQVHYRRLRGIGTPALFVAPGPGYLGSPCLGAGVVALSGAAIPIFTAAAIKAGLR